MKKTIVINGIKYLKSECTYIFGFLIKKGAPFNGIEHENYHNNQLKNQKLIIKMVKAWIM